MKLEIIKKQNLRLLVALVTSLLFAVAFLAMAIDPAPAPTNKAVRDELNRLADQMTAVATKLTDPAKAAATAAATKAREDAKLITGDDTATADDAATSALKAAKAGYTAAAEALAGTVVAVPVAEPKEGSVAQLDDHCGAGKDWYTSQPETCCEWSVATRDAATATALLETGSQRAAVPVGSTRSTPQ
jgi:hypothetical protein